MHSSGTLLTVFSRFQTANIGDTITQPLSIDFIVCCQQSTQHLMRILLKCVALLEWEGGLYL